MWRQKEGFLFLLAAELAFYAIQVFLLYQKRVGVGIVTIGRRFSGVNARNSCDAISRFRLQARRLRRESRTARRQLYTCLNLNLQDPDHDSGPSPTASPAVQLSRVKLLAVY